MILILEQNIIIILEQNIRYLEQSVIKTLLE